MRRAFLEQKRMKTLQFPMTLTHRSNPHAQVVVANAEQLAEIPAEYLLETVDGTPAVVTAAAAVPGVNLDTGTGDNSTAIADDAERRQSLDEAVDEFTAHVQAEETRLAGMRDQIEQDRATLREQTAALTEQQEALARERADFEAQRAAVAGTGDIGGDTGAASAAAEGAATGDTVTPPAAPAKRTRGTAKAEG
jgi:TolA-binding protein